MQDIKEPSETLNTHMHTQRHTRTHVWAHTHTYTQTQVFSNSLFQGLHRILIILISKKIQPLRIIPKYNDEKLKCSSRNIWKANWKGQWAQKTIRNTNHPCRLPSSFTLIPGHLPQNNHLNFQAKRRKPIIRQRSRTNQIIFLMSYTTAISWKNFFSQFPKMSL